MLHIRAHLQIILFFFSPFICITTFVASHFSYYGCVKFWAFVWALLLIAGATIIILAAIQSFVASNFGPSSWISSIAGWLGRRFLLENAVNALLPTTAGQALGGAHALNWMR